ncbi:MAG: hypothetical protein CHACPFDD_03017 [Phycisphaerae bacterium]|nr:hypothetical protein [Phycisphaerae bacterium]
MWAGASLIGLYAAMGMTRASAPPAVNEVFGWSWVAVGLAAGAWLGMHFQKPDFLGGYQSYPRRLVRLGHIACVALGLMNVLFAHSAARCLATGAAAASGTPSRIAAAAWLLIVGAITMPLCCGLTAWRPALKPAFVVPVATLLTGVILTALEVAAR